MGDRDIDAASQAVASGDDRRDSPRQPVRVLVREVALGGSFEPREGNVAVGGLFYTAPHPPAGTRVELRFIVPGARDEILARGEVLHVERSRAGFGVHVRFVDLPLEAELAVARWLDRGAP